MNLMMIHNSKLVQYINLNFEYRYNMNDGRSSLYEKKFDELTNQLIIKEDELAKL